MDLVGLVQLLSAIDFVGISAYAPIPVRESSSGCYHHQPLAVINSHCHQ